MLSQKLTTTQLLSNLLGDYWNSTQTQNYFVGVLLGNPMASALVDIAPFQAQQFAAGPARPAGIIQTFRGHYVASSLSPPPISSSLRLRWPARPSITYSNSWSIAWRRPYPLPPVPNTSLHSRWPARSSATTRNTQTKVLVDCPSGILRHHYLMPNG